MGDLKGCEAMVSGYKAFETGNCEYQYYHKGNIDKIQEEKEKGDKIENDPSSDEEFREAKELEDRFRTLFYEYKKGMLNNRDELNRLLQEMLRKYLITNDEYEKSHIGM